MTRFIPLLPILLLGSTIFSACAGRFDYVKPTYQATSANAKVIEKPREEVWNAAIPALGKQFFVINNLDKSSGLINLSYSGDPEAYIECGQITSYVKNLRGERTYTFAAAKADQTYEVMVQGLFLVHRTMAMEGRVNLIFEEIDARHTQVTVNTRYIVNRSVNYQDHQGHSGSLSHAISFNTGSGASFPATSSQVPIECFANGRLESSLLALIN